MKKFDVAIIGGGISGLTAAVYLALAGMSVVVLEKGKNLGGRAQTIKKNGALLNLGGHALYRGGAAENILKELGVNVRGGIPDTKGNAIWNGKLHALPDSLTTMFTTKLLSWSGKMELGKVMLKLRKMDAHTIPKMSLREWAEKEIRDPMVRHVFYALCRTSTYCIDTDSQVAGAVIKQVQQGMKGVRYVDGGWQSIVDDIREKAVKAGVTILTHRAVSSIEYEQQQQHHHLYFSDGETLEVPYIIITAGPEQTNKLVKGAEQTSIQKWTNQAKPIFAACLDVALRKLPNPSQNFAIGVDQHILYTNQSRAAKLTEDGSQVIHVLKYLGTEKQGNAKMHEEELEQIMDLLQPGWREEVVARQFLPHIAVVQDSITIDDTQFFGPSVPEIPGLYIAGDGAGHGEMLVDAAFSSSKRAAETIIQQFSAHGFQREA